METLYEHTNTVSENSVLESEDTLAGAGVGGLTSAFSRLQGDLEQKMHIYIYRHGVTTRSGTRSYFCT